MAPTSEKQERYGQDCRTWANGELSILTNIVRTEQSGGIAVFNIEVEGNHNYFILAKEYELGQTCVLVHNGKVCWRRMKQNPDGTPVVGDAADKLGVRAKDIPVNQDGFVYPQTGGVSTSPLPEYLPTMNGKNLGDFQMDLDNLPDGLTYRPDPLRPKRHGFIEPSRPMKIETYKDLIYGTHEWWWQ